MERALEELPGVRAARVDMATKDVHVTYEGGATSRGAMEGAIARVDLRLRMQHWVHRLARALGGRT